MEIVPFVFVFHCFLGFIFYTRVFSIMSMYLSPRNSVPVITPTIASFLFSYTCQSDTLVIVLVWLTLWVFSLVYQFNRITSGSLFLNMTLLLMAICIMFFYTTKSMSFYIYFEMSIPPTLFLIMVYGYQPEKLTATSYLVLYTVLSSLPMLLVLLTLPLYLYCIPYSVSVCTVLAMTFCFMVKTPMYLVHVWLPKAHVEAPVAGSMVLAGVLLKMGSYGLFIFLPIYDHWVLFVYLSASVVGGVVCCFSCVRQWDTKGLIAYSSIVHMGVVSVGLLSGSELGYYCGLIMVIAHGVCSPLLFGIAYYLYTNSSSRLLYHNRGNLSAPSVVLVLFALLAVNMGVPPFLNVWAEVMVFIVLMRLLSWSLPFLIVLAFCSFVYNICLYVMTSHGKESLSMSSPFTPWHYVSSLGLSTLLSFNTSFFLV